MEHWKHQKWRKRPKETPQQWRLRMMAELAGQPCYAGLDLSSTNDITAFSLWFPEKKVVLPFFWVPGESMELRQKEDAVPYLTWSNMGFIEQTDGAYIDQDRVVARILELNDIFHILKVGFDRWGAQWAYVHLAKHGLTCLRYGQGFGEMTGPVRRVSAMLGKQEFGHGGNPVLEWMFRNASGVYKDAKQGREVTDAMKDGLVRPDKTTSGEKIDGVMSTLMAIGVADSDEERSVYEDHGIRSMPASESADFDPLGGEEDD
jgi:phage terminase large subunit-like protein